MSEEKKVRKAVVKKGVTKKVAGLPVAEPVALTASEVKVTPTAKAMTKEPKASPRARAKPESFTIEDIIRLRAYEIYLQRGGTPGNQHEDWQVAEREVRQHFEQTASGQEAEA